jgi:ATP-dependent protease ClpP protease subunit
MPQRLDDDNEDNYSKGQVHIIENKRTIIMEGALSEQLAIPVIRAMYDFSFNPGPIFLWVYSYGGDLDATYAIYDTMQLLNKNGRPVTTVGFGNIASAATVLILGGETRLALESTNFMVHSIEYSFSGAPAAGKSFHNTVNKSQEKYYQLLGKGTLKTKEFWKKQIKDHKEYWFGTKEAKTYGLIHSIMDAKAYGLLLEAYGSEEETEKE